MDARSGLRNGLKALALCLGLILLASPAGAQSYGPEQRIDLDSIRVVAGESKTVKTLSGRARMISVLSVTSTPELMYPPRVAMAAGDDAPVRLTFPPTTPEGEYSVELMGRSQGGQSVVVRLRATVDPLLVSKSSTGRPPVILLNGFQLSCLLTGSGSTESDSEKTFANMWNYLESDSAAVLYFNNCAYGDISIEQLAAALKVYIEGLRYSDGTRVTQVDLVAHSMGGLIVRAYLSGKQPVSGTFIPLVNPTVRKAIFIATPHFGSPQAALVIDPQALEMRLGGQMLWDLATWNQRQDDLRGVDAIAVIGNAGSYYGSGGLDDGVVSLTSASLSFAKIDQNTRIVPYCHVDPQVTVFGIGVACFAPNTGIAQINSTSHLTWQIVHSFLSGTANWASIGHSPSQDPYLGQYGGITFEESSATGLQLKLTQAAFGTVTLQNSPSVDGLSYTEFVKGSGNFTTSSVGAISCGPFVEPAGYYSTVSCKPAVEIASVTPLLSTAPGIVVGSGTTVTISGNGFSSSTGTSVTANGIALTGSIVSDQQINAFLPATYSGLVQLVVANSAGRDSINIMAVPTVTTSAVSIQTNPPGLQFTVDGATPQISPQTLSLTNAVPHTVSVVTPQAGLTGTQYVFTSWSDGGAAAHAITLNGPATLTATFRTQYQLSTAVSPALAGTVAPSTGIFYDAGSAVPISTIAKSGYAFSSWSGPVANPSAASTTITMGTPQAVVANFLPTSPAPTITSGGIVPLYSPVPVIQPGSWISIYGSNLANGTTVWNGDFPTSLGGVTVTINNKLGYLWVVSPGQINLQAPDDSTTGPVNVVITTPDGTARSLVTLASAGPSFSLLDGKHPAGLILTQDGSGAYGNGSYDIVGPSGLFSFNTRPVRAGETLELFGVGFGPTNPPVAAGQVFSGAAPTANIVGITIGGVTANVQFAGITSAGLYQFNVVVPITGSGDQMMQATVGGAQSPGGVYVTVQ